MNTVEVNFLVKFMFQTVEAWSVVMLSWDGIPGTHDQPWQVLLGWGLYFAGWAIICVTALRQVCIQVDYNICQVMFYVIYKDYHHF